jgi:DNA polymerase-3 subunit alpha
LGDSKTIGLSASDYVHLHNHTQYSLLDGLTKVPALVEYCKDTGMVAVAQTDHGTLSGAIDFYKHATEKGVKPILGIETYVAARTIYDKEPGKDKMYYHLIILARASTTKPKKQRSGTKRRSATATT